MLLPVLSLHHRHLAYTPRDVFGDKAFQPVMLMRDRRFAICAGTSYLKIRALLLNQKHHILRRILRRIRRVQDPRTY